MGRGLLWNRMLNDSVTGPLPTRVLAARNGLCAWGPRNYRRPRPCLCECLLLCIGHGPPRLYTGDTKRQPNVRRIRAIERRRSFEILRPWRILRRRIFIEAPPEDDSLNASPPDVGVIAVS